MAHERIHVDLVIDQKAMRALALVLEVLNEVAEDFEYREDVKRAVRAARYLTKNVRVDCSESLVSSEIQAAIDKHPEVNWSDVARKAFMDEIRRLETQ